MLSWHIRFSLQGLMNSTQKNEEYDLDQGITREIVNSNSTSSSNDDQEEVNALHVENDNIESMRSDDIDVQSIIETDSRIRNISSTNDTTTILTVVNDQLLQNNIYFNEEYTRTNNNNNNNNNNDDELSMSTPSVHSSSRLSPLPKIYIEIEDKQQNINESSTTTTSSPRNNKCTDPQTTTTIPKQVDEDIVKENQSQSQTDNSYSNNKEYEKNGDTQNLIVAHSPQSTRSSSSKENHVIGRLSPALTGPGLAKPLSSTIMPNSSHHNHKHNHKQSQQANSTTPAGKKRIDAALEKNIETIVTQVKRTTTKPSQLTQNDLELFDSNRASTTTKNTHHHHHHSRENTPSIQQLSSSSREMTPDSIDNSADEYRSYTNGTTATTSEQFIPHAKNGVGMYDLNSLPPSWQPPPTLLPPYHYHPYLPSPYGLPVPPLQTPTNNYYNNSLATQYDPVLLERYGPAALAAFAAVQQQHQNSYMIHPQHLNIAPQSSQEHLSGNIHYPQSCFRTTTSSSSINDFLINTPTASTPISASPIASTTNHQHHSKKVGKKSNNNRSLNTDDTSRAVARDRQQVTTNELSSAKRDTKIKKQVSEMNGENIKSPVDKRNEQLPSHLYLNQITSLPFVTLYDNTPINNSNNNNNNNNNNTSQKPVENYHPQRKTNNITNELGQIGSVKSSCSGGSLKSDSTSTGRKFVKNSNNNNTPITTLQTSPPSQSNQAINDSLNKMSPDLSSDCEYNDTDSIISFESQKSDTAAGMPVLEDGLSDECVSDDNNDELSSSSDRRNRQQRQTAHQSTQSDFLFDQQQQQQQMPPILSMSHKRNFMKVNNTSLNTNTEENLNPRYTNRYNHKQQTNSSSTSIATTSPTTSSSNNNLFSSPTSSNSSSISFQKSFYIRPPPPSSLQSHDDNILTNNNHNNHLPRYQISSPTTNSPTFINKTNSDINNENRHPSTTVDYDTDEETDKLLGCEYRSDAIKNDRTKDPTPKAGQPQPPQQHRTREVLTHTIVDPDNSSVLIEGVLFRCRYLGSTQLLVEGNPTKATRMTQAQEAVGRIKAPQGESQPSVEVDLFISTEKIMVLNTDLQDVLMDHSLRSISYIADIGDLVVLMAKRRYINAAPVDDSNTNDDQNNSSETNIRRVAINQKMICHVFESEEAQSVAHSIGQAFQVAYVEFLKANGIDDPSFARDIDYQEVLNQQEICSEELNRFSKKECQKEVIIPKQKSEGLGMVIVESGWGSMLPTVVIANLMPGGPSARCGNLNIGDQIISVNGISLVGLPLSNCQTQIKNVKHLTTVRLVVVPCPPVVEVLIKRPDTKYQLGFSVQNGIICSLLRGGIAERGGVRVGHRIIEINGHSVVATQHEKIVSMLSNSVGELRMKTMPTQMYRLLTGQEQPNYI
ncbi:unnamed protein product [Didymodactylos carnosus]|uniref:Uncharacterized protein n=1 Tax=Didymodactylos carnosus TaxID=1234261 RepID=A0A8S2D5X1_9BILA|nr:unnamed protein product [Didymodactylos carnosus]CAF3631082.1 unnamed protein product [Didymodactylos carnosus]